MVYVVRQECAWESKNIRRGARRGIGPQNQIVAVPSERVLNRVRLRDEVE